MFKGVPGCIEGIPGHYGMIQGVPGCSDGVLGVFWAVPGVFRGVPGFTDTPDFAVFTVTQLVRKLSKTPRNFTRNLFTPFTQTLTDI